MTRYTCDYSKTVIYRIVCRDSTIPDIYVGHSTNLKIRIRQHKLNCMNEKSAAYNIPVYKFIRENGGWNNWQVLKIEEYPCETKNHACIRERHWLLEYGASLNCVQPSRTMKES